MRLFSPKVVLNGIEGITRAAGLSPDQSPCLHLPAEVWDGPRLLSKCPLCHKPLRFNPFIVDNRYKYPEPRNDDGEEYRATDSVVSDATFLRPKKPWWKFWKK